MEEEVSSQSHSLSSPVPVLPSSTIPSSLMPSHGHLSLANGSQIKRRELLRPRAQLTRRRPKDADYTVQRMILGTHTSSQASDQLLIAEVLLPKAKDEEVAELYDEEKQGTSSARARVHTSQNSDPTPSLRRGYASNRLSITMEKSTGRGTCPKTQI